MSERLNPSGMNPEAQSPETVLLSMQDELNQLKQRQQELESFVNTPGFRASAEDIVSARFDLRDTSSRIDSLQNEYNSYGGAEVDKLQSEVDSLGFKATAEDHVEARSALREAKDVFLQNYEAANKPVDDKEPLALNPGKPEDYSSSTTSAPGKPSDGSSSGETSPIAVGPGKAHGSSSVRDSKEDLSGSPDDYNQPTSELVEARDRLVDANQNMKVELSKADYPEKKENLITLRQDLVKLQDEAQKAEVKDRINRLKMAAEAGDIYAEEGLIGEAIEALDDYINSNKDSLTEDDIQILRDNLKLAIDTRDANVVFNESRDKTDSPSQDKDSAGDKDKTDNPIKDKDSNNDDSSKKDDPNKPKKGKEGDSSDKDQKKKTNRFRDRLKKIASKFKREKGDDSGQGEKNTSKRRVGAAALVLAGVGAVSFAAGYLVGDKDVPDHIEPAIELDQKLEEKGVSEELREKIATDPETAEKFYNMTSNPEEFEKFLSNRTEEIDKREKQLREAGVAESQVSRSQIADQYDREIRAYFETLEALEAQEEADNS